MFKKTCISLRQPFSCDFQQRTGVAALSRYLKKYECCHSSQARERPKTPFEQMSNQPSQQSGEDLREDSIEKTNLSCLHK